MGKAWVSIDAGKGFHEAVMLHAEGKALLSRRAENEEADLSSLVNEALELGQELTWDTNQPGGTAALLLVLLWKRISASSICPASRWIELETPAVASPRPIPATGRGFGPGSLLDIFIEIPFELKALLVCTASSRRGPRLLHETHLTGSSCLAEALEALKITVDRAPGACLSNQGNRATRGVESSFLRLGCYPDA